MKDDAATPSFAPTPFAWRVAIAVAIAFTFVCTYLVRTRIEPWAQSAIGAVCLLGLVFLFSANLRAINLQTVGWGIALQLLLAIFILRFEVPWATALGLPSGFRPGYALFEGIAAVIRKFLEFSNRGAEMVFGALASQKEMERVFGAKHAFVFAFMGLPTIIFVSAFFTILYYFGVLQFIVRVFARGMMRLMRTSGAETLSAAANVFMGQTEAPLIIKPYVERMTRSELVALMVGGMATISGGLMAVYIGMGADAVALLATSVMAAPCGLYLSKIMLPELESPDTLGEARVEVKQPYRNVVDAAAAGTSDGLQLALNVAAMLVSFLALLALVDYLLGLLPTSHSLWQTLADSAGWDLIINLGQTLAAFAVVALLVRWWLRKRAVRLGFPVGLLMLALGYVVFLALLDVGLRILPPQLSMSKVFSYVFSPIAFMIGVQGDDMFKLANLLGTKLATNEFIAYLELTTQYRGEMSQRAYDLATFALTGFANFGSLGILLGGIGVLAPSRRGDLAALSGRALFAGFMTTIINAAIAGVLLN